MARRLIVHLSRLGCVVLFCLLVAPTSAYADFVWPPGLYMYTYSFWWVVVGGLFVEGVVYFFAWRRGLWRTLILTIGINLASAGAGAIFSLFSLLFLDIGKAPMIAFVYASPVLVFGMTVAAEYFAGTIIFSLPDSRRTIGVITLANVPSVALSFYAIGRLMGESLGR